MGWVENRLEEWKHGKKFGYWERRCLEHANPVHSILMVIGIVFLVYGLWMHNWMLIWIGVGLNFLGHLCCWLKK